MSVVTVMNNAQVDPEATQGHCPACLVTMQAMLLH